MVFLGVLALLGLAAATALPRGPAPSRAADAAPAALDTAVEAG
jgi:hypothetical protein